MNVSIWANHGPKIFGVSDNLHLTELFAVLQYPMPQGFTSFSAVVNPTTFATVQIEANSVIHGTKRRCQRSHQAPEKRRRPQRGRQAQAHWVSCKKTWLSGFLGINVSWSHLKIEAKAIATRKPLAGQPCLTYTLGHEELSSGCSREFHVRGSVVINTSQQAADTNRSFSSLDHREDPGMIDAGIGSSRVRQ